MKHLLVTNDFPPKLGGIQSYLWELWRRLPAEDATVLTTPYAGHEEWDKNQPFRVVRTREPVLLPHRGLVKQIDALAEECGAELIIFDPVLPLGAVGPRCSRPYALFVHGAEMTIPGRLPGSRQLMGSLLRNAELVLSSSRYPFDEAERAAGRALAGAVITPGVDLDRFIPLNAAAKVKARAKLGLPTDGQLVVSVSRLVPRKGMDTLIRASARLRGAFPELTVAIAGGGREAASLRSLAQKLDAPVSFLGRVADEDLPLLYGAGDLFAMLCRNRWWGLEQEGFGIVFLEAAACGVAQVAGRSGGSHEAVLDGETGVVVDDPEDVTDVAMVIADLLNNEDLRASMGAASRERAERYFANDVLADSLAQTLGDWAAAKR